MSEPDSVILQASISKPRLVAYLRATPVPASSWPDWDHLFDFYGNHFAPEDRAALIAHADDKLTNSGASYRSTVRRLITDSFSRDNAVRFSYDENANELLPVDVMFSERVEDFIRFLTLARGLAAYLEEGEEGYAVVRNHIRDGYTIAAMRLQPGRSFFVERDGHWSATLTEKATTEFSVTLTGYGHAEGQPSPLLDPIGAPLDGVALLIQIRIMADRTATARTAFLAVDRLVGLFRDDRLDRHRLGSVQPADLRPVFHLDHPPE